MVNFLGWDAAIKFWDPRAPCASGTYAQQEKVYTMALCGDKLVVGTAGRRGKLNLLLLFLLKFIFFQYWFGIYEIWVMFNKRESRA